MNPRNNDWVVSKVSDFGQVVTGGTPSTKRQEFFGENYPFITPTDIDNSSRFVKTARFLSEAGYKNQESRLLPAGSVCVVCIGATIGKICMTYAPSFTNQQINSIIVDQNKHDNAFLYYLLRTQAEQLKSIAGGAATPIVNKSAYSNIEFLVPPLPTQRKIAAILSSYDDLIENNTHRIQILEEIAQAIYREWFVHFRFPGYENVRMVDSGTELGEIPEGWKMRTLGDFGEVITGKTPSKKVDEYWNGQDVPFIRTPDMHNQLYCLQTTDYLSQAGADSQSNKYLPLNSLCVSCIGTVGIVTITGQRAQTNQQINSIVLTKPIDLEFLYFSLLDLKETIQLYASTGATMSNLSKGKFMGLNLNTPTEELRSSYHKVVSPMFENIKALQLKNENLRSTRDLLLPRLVLGQVDISELDIVMDIN